MDNNKYYTIAKKGSITQQCPTIKNVNSRPRRCKLHITRHICHLQLFPRCFWIFRHVQLLTIMEYLGFPKGAIYLVGYMYTSSTISFHGSYFHNTLPIHINRGTIQRGTLGPYIFKTFFKSLLRWLEVGSLG